MKLTMCNDKNDNSKTIDKFDIYEFLMTIDLYDVIHQTEHNKKGHTEEAVNSTFDQVLNWQVEKARKLLKSNMDKILKHLDEKSLI
jgi:GTP cyclohydrolase FolE2